jgi:hypothetical protein
MLHNVFAAHRNKTLALIAVALFRVDVAPAATISDEQPRMVRLPRVHVTAVAEPPRDRYVTLPTIEVTARSSAEPGVVQATLPMLNRAWLVVDGKLLLTERRLAENLRCGQCVVTENDGEKVFTITVQPALRCM